MILFSRCVVPAVMACAFIMSSAGAEVPVVPSGKTEIAVAEKPPFSDPKAAYLSYIQAVRNRDPGAALKCWVYEPEQEEAMKVVAGIWIAHRRFEKAVDAVSAVKAEKKSLEGYVRPDVTEKALDAAAELVAGAEVKTAGETTELVIKWDDLKGDPEECFLSGDKPAFRKVDGQWKLTPVTADSSLLGDGDFFAKGGWGSMLRDGIAMLNEASDKLEKGEIKMPAELKSLLAERENEMKERYEKEKREAVEEQKPRPQ